MSRFEVLVLGSYLPKRGVEIAISSFSDFHHALTPKNQKKVVLQFVDNDKKHKQLIDKLLVLNDLSPKEVIYHHTLTKPEMTRLFKTSSILLLPTQESVGSLIMESLSHSLPVVCLNAEGLQEFIDMTCGAVITSSTIEQDIERFSNMLDCLYFDNEVLKILKRGAWARYEELFAVSSSRSVGSLPQS